MTPAGFSARLLGSHPWSPEGREQQASPTEQFSNGKKYLDSCLCLFHAQSQLSASGGFPWGGLMPAGSDRGYLLPCSRPKRG